MDAYDTVTTGNGWGAIGIDTLILVNGNVTSRHAYSQNGDTWILENSTELTSFSTYANPYYNAQVSNAFGAFFLDLGYVDLLSKQLPSTGVAHWTTDASGRVIAGLGTDGSSVTFTYQ